jgi:hypothetical protein
MKILSFDVGIKNLAFCVLEKIENKTEEFKIHHWGIINISNDCKCEVEDCGKLAQFVTQNKCTDISNFVCNKHKNYFLYECEECNDEKCYCGKDSIIGIKSIQKFWCQKHKKQGEKYIKNTKNKKVKSCMKLSTQELAINLFSILDKTYKHLIDVSEVLIENQPTFINPTMKTISALLYSYFIIRGMVETKKIKEVRFVSPSNKLKINTVKTDKTLENKKGQEAYKLTKNLSVQYCTALINDNDKTKLDEHSKKDDMCDAFLQAFQYLFNPVPKVLFDKLEKIGFDTEKKKRKTKPKKANKYV